MYMPVSAACQSCSFLGGQQQLLLHIPVLSFYQKLFMLVFDCLLTILVTQIITRQLFL